MDRKGQLDRIVQYAYVRGTTTGERDFDISGIKNMANTTTVLQQKEIHKLSWTPPDGCYQNQIDNVAINSKF